MFRKPTAVVRELGLAEDPGHPMRHRHEREAPTPTSSTSAVTAGVANNRLWRLYQGRQ